MGRRRRRRETPLSHTFVVAAVDSRDPAMADYRCNGIADETEINLALAALGAAEGVIILLEGTFTTAASIAFTANNQTLRGQGRSTYIDGTGLPAGAHAIVLSGFTDCHILDLAVETQAGGLNVTHCVFIEDGANDFHVRGVTIVNSDDDGIHVEGTSIIQGHIHLCHVEAADGIGIAIVPGNFQDFTRFHVEDNDVLNCGGAGISIAGDGSAPLAQVVNNAVYTTGGHGIEIASSQQSLVRGNIIQTAGDNGIDGNQVNNSEFLGNIINGSTNEGIYIQPGSAVVIVGNECVSNGGSGIEAGGVLSVITGNVVDGNTLEGIHLAAGAHYSTVSGNTINNNSENGILVEATYCTINGNICHYNDKHGVYLNGGGNHVVIGNNCIDNDFGDTNAFDGISIYDSSKNLVSGNRCSGNDRHGIFVDGDSDDNKIHGNYLTGNPNGDITVGAAACDHTEIVFNTIEDGAIGDAGTLTRAAGNFDPSANAYIALIGAAPF